MQPNGDIHLVRWPQEADSRRRCSEAGWPCLLVVEPGTELPPDLRAGEDWVRSTADPLEVRSRLERLRRLSPQTSLRPTLDGDGILIHNGRWVALGPIDVALARRLCDQFGRLVTRDELRGCFEPACSDATLAVKLYRLRRHLAPLGLEVATVRGRGYLLQAVSSGLQPPGPSLAEPTDPPALKPATEHREQHPRPTIDR